MYLSSLLFSINFWPPFCRDKLTLCSCIVGGLKKKSEKRIKKEEYWHKLQDLAGEYSKAILVDVDNVSSKQINQIRLKLRPINAKMIMGKNVSLFFRLILFCLDLDEGRS